MESIKHVGSISGGRTSMGPMIKSMINSFGKDNCDFVFCDTGAEDKDTYRFIRDVREKFGIEITCIRLNMPKEKGKGGNFELISIDDIGPNYYAWKQLTSKYGNPYMPGGKFCTQQMKGEIFKKYCDNTYGKGKYYTWIGYRFEEGNRIWGKFASASLGKMGLSNVEKTQFYLDCVNGANLDDLMSEYLLSDDDDYASFKDKINKALITIKTKMFRFMPEVSNLQKQDVIAWWGPKDYDLKIESHRHNCLFCIEKPHGTIMLAIKDCPKEALEFLNIVESQDVADKPNRKYAGDVMYRKGVTFRSLYEKAIKSSRDDILEMSRIGQAMIKKNPCQAGECSPFGNIHEEVEVITEKASEPLSNPFNYTGSKFRYLNDYMEILPKEDDLTVLDPFFGGGDLSTNLNKTWSVDANDLCHQLIEVHQAIQHGLINVDSVKKCMEHYNLSKTNESDYYAARDEYREQERPMLLYAILCHSNSNRIRWSGKGFDMPFGKRTFNSSMQKKLNNYIDRVSKRKIELYSKSVFDFDFNDYDIKLLDPPYHGTDATYNAKWTAQHEIDLINKAESSTGKFVYFGQLISNGVKNEEFTKFAFRNKFKLLKETTSHCSANKKNNGKTMEVMVYNF